MLWAAWLVKHGRRPKGSNDLYQLSASHPSPQQTRHATIRYMGRGRPVKKKEEKRIIEQGRASPKKPVPSRVTPFSEDVARLWKVSENTRAQDDGLQQTIEATSRETYKLLEPSPVTQDDSQAVDTTENIDLNTPKSLDSAYSSKDLTHEVSAGSPSADAGKEQSDKSALLRQEEESEEANAVRPVTEDSLAPKPWDNDAIFSLLEELGEELQGEAETQTDGDDGMGDKEPWEDLPLSPLMHPELIKARERYRTTKARPSSDKVGFEADVARNPFGGFLDSEYCRSVPVFNSLIHVLDIVQALATPIRFCRLTASRLPRAFMLPFSLRKHPDTEFPWMVPMSFYPTTEERFYVDRSPGAAPQNEGFVKNNDRSSEALSHQSSIPTKQLVSQSASRLPQKVKRNLSGCYFLATSGVATKLPRIEHRTRTQCLPTRWKLQFSNAFLNSVVCRKDMDAFLLGLMQIKVIRLLAYVASLDMEHVLPWTQETDSSTDDPQEQNYVKDTDPKPGGCGLWLGPRTQDDSLDEPPETLRVSAAQRGLTLDRTKNDIRGFVFRDAQGRPTTVLDLEHLLSKKQMKWLREQNPLFRKEAVFLQAEDSTLNVMQRLWQLALYVGESEITVPERDGGVGGVEG